MRELYIDASRGLAGDMLCAALLQLFDEPETILDALNGLGLPGVCYALQRAESHSVTGCRLLVSVEGEIEGEGDHHHRHRKLADIAGIVAQSSLQEALKEKVLRVYRSIAEAEGRVHGTTPELVHFHELGAMDAVADISAACFLLNALQPARVTVSPVCTGFGTVRTAHGLLPVPAPATALLLEGIPSFAGTLEGELCTPTGAALARAFADRWGRQPDMTVRRLGYGLGKKNFGALSCVRVLLGEAEETVLELCCNVDDMSPEDVGFALEELLRRGALDAWYEAIGMKKTRPGLLLSCLCRENQREEMLSLLFRHTSTLGVRETLCRRYVLRRGEEMQSTPFGSVRWKQSEGYGVTRRKAEYEDLARIAREQDLSLRELREILDGQG